MYAMSMNKALGIIHKGQPLFRIPGDQSKWRITTFLVIVNDNLINNVNLLVFTIQNVVGG